MISCPNCKHVFSGKGLFVLGKSRCPVCNYEFYALKYKWINTIIIVSYSMIYCLLYNIVYKYFEKLFHGERWIYFLVSLCVGVVGLYILNYIIAIFVYAMHSSKRVE